MTGEVIGGLDNQTLPLTGKLSSQSATKILMLPHQRGNISPRRPMGGGPTTFFELAASLRKTGAEVTFLGAFDEQESFIHQGVNFQCVKGGETLKQHLFLMAENDFDIVIAQRASRLDEAMQCFPKAVGLLRVIDTFIDTHQRSPEQINEIASLVIAVSDYVKGLLVRFGVQESKIVVAHEGLPEVFRPLSSVHREKNLVIFAGATVPVKGLPILMEALDLLNVEGVDFKFEIYGSAALWSGMKERTDWASVCANRTNWTYCGIADQESLARAYNRAAICVVPTDPRHVQEGLGRVSLEAQACGCPVLVSRSGGLPETVVDGITGRIVDPLTPKTLAVAIKALLLDPITHQAMSVAAARQETQTTVDDIAANILSLAERFEKSK